MVQRFNIRFKQVCSSIWLGSSEADLDWPFAVRLLTQLALEMDRVVFCDNRHWPAAKIPARNFQPQQGWRKLFGCWRWIKAEKLKCIRILKSDVLLCLQKWWQTEMMMMNLPTNISSFALECPEAENRFCSVALLFFPRLLPLFFCPSSLCWLLNLSNFYFALPSVPACCRNLCPCPLFCTVHTHPHVQTHNEALNVSFYCCFPPFSQASSETATQSTHWFSNRFFSSND